jgi:hypothetical protein
LLNSNDDGFTLDDFVEIWKQSALEEAEEHEPQPEEGTVRVSEWTDGFGLTAAGIKAFEDNDSKERRSATMRQGLMGTKKSQRRRRGLSLDRFQCLVSSSLPLGLVHRHLYCLNSATVPGAHLQSKGKCILLELSLVCQT